MSVDLSVSVVIPAYNAAGFLERTIRSALDQTVKALEIIVVDDGSTDETPKIAERFPVKVIRQSNGGPGAARNAGVQAARGEIIALLDHDDIWFPEKTAVQLSFLEPDVDAVFCHKGVETDEINFESMFWENLGGNPSASLIRKAAIQGVGGFDDDRRMIGLDDYNFWLKFLLAGYRLRTTPVLYEFTPADTHYSGNAEKMYLAELVNLEKIIALANVDLQRASRRRAKLREQYIGLLADQRSLPLAREVVKEMGTFEAYLRYGKVFLPRSVLDLKRRLLA